MAYATVAQLRAVLTQAPTGAEADALMQTMLDWATGVIDGILKFSFAPWGAASSRDIEARAYDVYLPLPACQAGSVSAVLEIGGRATDDETTTAVTDYVAEEDAVPYRLYRGAGWKRGTFYRVTAVWGYGPAPEVVAGICLDLAKTRWGTRHARTAQGAIGVEGAGAIDGSRILSAEQYLTLRNVRSGCLGGPQHA